MSETKFAVGDKVRYTRPKNTLWQDAEGLVIACDGWLTTVTLTTDVDIYFIAGKVAKLYTNGLDLVEDVKFPVGSIVEFWNEINDHWQGGKGKVVANPSKTWNAEGAVDVEILEKMPLNNLQRPGTIVAVYEKDLRAYLEEWEQEVIGWGRAPKPEAEEESEADKEEKPVDNVNDPAHYGGKDNPFEVIKVAEAWGLDKDAYLFNVLKYIARAGKKGSKQEDLEKAEYYINRRINHPLEV